MIETPRLILRVPAPGDRAAFHALWADPLVMADLAPVKSAEQSDATLAHHDSYRSEGLGFLAVECKADGAVIGFCGLKRGAPDVPVAGELEVGWIFAADRWGQGYAFEASAASIAWGWANTDAPRIVAITSACNARSWGLMERLGMTRLPDGDFEHAKFAPGDRLRAMVTYAIARPA